MGLWLTLDAAEDRKPGVYGTGPAAKPNGGVVNHPIRSLCGRLAGEGDAPLKAAGLRKSPRSPT